MNAPDLGFLGPARQARAEAARDARLAEEEAPRPAPEGAFATLMRAEDGASKSAPRPAPAGAEAGDPAAVAPGDAAELTATRGEETSDAAARSGAPERQGAETTGPAPAEARDAAPDSGAPPIVTAAAPAPAPAAAPDLDLLDPPGVAAPDAAAVPAVGAEAADTGEALGSEAAPDLDAPTGETVAPESRERIADGAGRPERRAARAGAPAEATLTDATDSEARGPEVQVPSTREGAARREVEVARTGHTAADAEGAPVAIDPGGAEPLPFALTRSGAGGADWRLVPGAPAHAADPTRAAVDPRAVIGQITVALAAGDGSRVEIRLDPAELGRVRIALSRTERGLHASVTAERPETLDLLRRNADALTRELAAAGYDTVSLDMARGGQDPEAGARTPGRRDALYAAAGLAPEDPAAAAPSASAPPRAGGGPLDIRL